MIRDEIPKGFPELFGTKKVNGRAIDVEQAIDLNARVEAGHRYSVGRAARTSAIPGAGQKNMRGQVGTTSLRIP